MKTNNASPTSISSPQDFEDHMAMVMVVAYFVVTGVDLDGGDQTNAHW